ncbi:MAG: DUF1214 domain-containing protein [Bryobacteraceae bacterium]
MSVVSRWLIVSLILALSVRFAILHVFGFQPHPRSLGTEVFQGLITGVVLGCFTAEIFARIKMTKVNGWITLLGCGVPGNGMLFRAACALRFMGPVNIPQEAVYWITSKHGRRNYTMHFPPGGLPPNDAFWSLTMGDGRNRFVANPMNRYSVSDRTGLVPKADGSVDIYIQNTAPTGHESNWLPAPEGRFLLWLRVYVPGAAMLDGTYKVPPVVEGKP